MNLLPLPKHFDQNEWYIIFSLIALVLLLKLLPKRFPTSVTILIVIFSMSTARIIDHLLAGPNINLYDILDSGKYELFDILSYAPYAPFAYVFVYFYDKWKIQGIKISLYILCTSLIGTGWEWLTSTSIIHFIHYKGWKPIYSLAVYLTIQPLTLLFFHYIQLVHRKSLNEKRSAIR